jgi:hypothetical protein
VTTEHGNSFDDDFGLRGAMLPKTTQRPTYTNMTDSEFKQQILSLANEGISLLKQILQGVLMADVTLSALTADVASETTLEGSILQILNNVQAALTAALANVTIPAAAQAQIDAIDASIQANIGTLTNAVAANTSAAPVTPILPAGGSGA